MNELGRLIPWSEDPENPLSDNFEFQVSSKSKPYGVVTYWIQKLRESGLEVSENPIRWTRAAKELLEQYSLEETIACVTFLTSPFSPIYQHFFTLPYLLRGGMELFKEKKKYPPSINRGQLGPQGPKELV